MFLTNLFNLTKECSHERVAPDLDFSYCPDCGKLIYNEWYITRCACCGIKLKTYSRNNKIYPQYHYCKNCGSSSYHVEKLDKINFIDASFAVLIRKETKEDIKASTTQCWQEKTIVQPKLSVKYL